MLRIMIGVMVFLLVGCTAWSPHAPLELSSPKTTRSGLKIVSQSVDLSRVVWWKKMHDRALNDLIKQALVNNNQIETAKANVLQAQAAFKEAQFAWLPTLGASGNGLAGGGWDTQFTPQGVLAQSSTLSKLGSIHFRGYYAGFVPSYSLNILANINTNKFARASLNMQRAVYQSTRLSIISQTSGSYFMLLGQKEQLSEQSQLIHDLKTRRRLEWIRYKQGASDLSAVTEIDQQIANNEASLTSIENSIAQLENAIQVLINRNPGPIITHGHMKALSVRGLIPSNLPSEVLKNRPDIMMAQENLNMAESNIGTAYSNFFPTISLTGLLGGASLELSHLLTLSTGVWLAQAAASMPLLNGRYYEQIKGANAGYKAACFSYIQTLRLAFADVDNSLTHNQKLQDAYGHQLVALQASNRAYRLVLARYKAGATDYREVVNAKLNLDYAKLNLNLAKMQQLDSIVEVYQALAGGYKTAS